MILVLLHFELSAGATLKVGNLFKTLVEKVLPADYKLDWKSAKIDFSFSGGSFIGKELCLKEKQSDNRVCFDTAELNLKISKFQIDPNNSSVVLRGGQVSWALSDSSKSQSQDSPSIDIYKVLKESLEPLLKFKMMKVEVDVMQALVGDFKLSQIKLRNEPTTEKKSSNLELALDRAENSKINLRQAELKAQAKIRHKTLQLDLDGSVKLKNQPKVSWSLKVPSFEPNISIPIDVEVKTVYKDKPVFLSAKTNVTSSGVNGRLGGEIKLPKGPVKLPCEFELSRQVQLKDINCKINTELSRFVQFSRESKKSNPVKVPLTGGLRCISEKCEVNLNANDIFNLIVKSDVDLNKQGQQKGSLSLKIIKFKKVSEILNQMEFGFPVPFANYTGSINISSSFTHKEFKSWSIPIKLNSSLNSKNQVMNLTANLETKMKDKKVNLDGEILINDVQVILPRLKLGGIPKFSKDQRVLENQEPQVQSARKKSKQEAVFSYNLTVKTSQPGKLKILSDRLENPLSLSCNIKLASEAPLSGWIKIEETQIELLKRQATIKRLKIDFAKEMPDSKLNGLLTAQQSIYDIQIFIQGTLADPVVRLESNPVLSENEIVSVLLYGHRTTDIGGDGEVADAKAQIAARSVGLVSLYVFSGTPIDSILYNSEEKSVTANLSLGQNRLSVTEQNSSIKSVGVERRLFKNIFLRTQRDFGDEASTTTTLEWENRY